MEESQFFSQQTKRCKAYPKNQRVTQSFTETIKFNVKGAHLVHKMALSYHFVSFDNLDSAQTKNLYRPLEKLKLIDALSIHLSEANIDCDFVLQNLSQKIKSLSSLRELKVILPYARWISPKGAKYLASALVQTKLLNRLILHFSYSDWWVNDEILHILLRSFKKYKALKSLNLNISHCTSITEKSFQHLGSTLSHSLQSLRELDLGFVGLNFGEGKNLDSFASGLANLTALQRLWINFSGVEIESTESFSSVMSSFKHLKSLKILQFYFSEIHLEISVLKDLMTSFKDLLHLHTLLLQFESNPTFAVQEMEILAQGLQSIASSLKNLTLDFNYSVRLDNQALEKLSVGLKALTSLSEIQLQFNSCPEIGNVGVNRVINELEGLPNLHSVSLDFRECQPISNTYEERLKMNKNIKNLSWGSDSIYEL